MGKSQFYLFFYLAALLNFVPKNILKTMAGFLVFATQILVVKYIGYEV